MQTKYQYEYLFPQEFDEAIKKCPVFFVPTGLLEWHANHLPFGLDALKIHGICLRAAEKLDGGIVLPVNYFGTPGFSTYLGTLTYSEEILRPLFMAYMEQLKKVGAKVIALITGHYGHTQVDFIHEIGRDFTAANPDVTIISRAEYEGVLVDGEEPADHGGKWETSMFMHLFPERLRINDYVTVIDDMKRYENAPFDYHKESAHWDFRSDVSKTASAELGRKAVEAITDLLVADVRKALERSAPTK